MTDYHSVYRPASGSVPQTRYAIGESVVFVHDIMTAPLPVEYVDCDVIYADLPWRAGFVGYNERVDVTDGRTYPQFLANVRQIVEASRVPVVLITGRHAVSHLSRPAQMLSVTMPVANDQPGVALLYGMTVGAWVDGARPDALLSELAGMFKCVGDFCCGYGSSVYAFLRAGKRFVASDYNAECIGYVAKNVGRWM